MQQNDNPNQALYRNLAMLMVTLFFLGMAAMLFHANLGASNLATAAAATGGIAVVAGHGMLFLSLRRGTKDAPNAAFPHLGKLEARGYIALTTGAALIFVAILATVPG